MNKFNPWWKYSESERYSTSSVHLEKKKGSNKNDGLIIVSN